MRKVEGKAPSPLRLPPLHNADLFALGLASSGAEKFLDVLSQQISFEVDCISHFSLAQRGDLISMWNDPNPEIFSADARHGKADAIHRDRAFEDDITHHVWRGGNVEHMVISYSFPPLDFAQSIDVAGDEMSV